MIHVIENEFIKAGIAETGAELKSLVLKSDGTEYMWQADPEFWASSASNIFPVCGRMTDGKYTYRGITYEMPNHGFARRSEWKVAESNADSIVFELLPDDKSRSMYPFEFALRMSYVLDGTTLKQTVIVKNNDEKTMYFAVGGHPGFNVPLAAGESFEDYYVEFDDAGTPKYFVMNPATCLYTGKTADFELEDGKRLSLRHSLFDDDAIFLTEMSHGVTLKSRKSDKSVHLSYPGMKTLGLWHARGKEAPFLCLEPWISVPGLDGVVEELEEKNMLEKLEPGKTYSNGFSITVR